MNSKKSFLQKVVDGPTEGQKNIVVCHKTLTPDHHKTFASMFVTFVTAGWNIHVLFEKPSQAKDFPKFGIIHSYLFPSDTVPTMAEHISDLTKVEMSVDIFLNSQTPEIHAPSRRIHWGVPPDNDTLKALESFEFTRKNKTIPSPTLEDLAQRSVVKGQRDF